MKYRKKPVVIEARQWTDDLSGDNIVRWSGCTVKADEDGLFIPTLEGVMRADLGDFIIRGVQGEFYPCKPDIFQATYEPEPHVSEDREPQPGDGPDYHAEHAAWSTRNPESDVSGREDER
jgi:hypothetical protein